MKISLLFIFFFNSIFAFSQAFETKILVVDEFSNPIEGAHVFILNSTIGEITDTQGKCVLRWPKDLAHQIVISHIGYENVNIGSELLKTSSEIFSVTLKINNNAFSEVVLIAKRDSRWRKNYKLFRKILLGEDKAADKCEILNPEVIRFNNDDGIFRAYADEAIKIRNHYLGYDITFILEELVEEPDGSSHYIGESKFADLHPVNVPGNIRKRRERSYISSRRHFFKNLIEQRAKEQGYEFSISKYHSGGFIELSRPNSQELLKFDSLSGFYHLYFPEFLCVDNKRVKVVDEISTKEVNSMESQRRINSSQTGEDFRMSFASSQLYKLSSYLILDVYGNVYNSTDLKEYGYWAKLRLGSMLPLDYKLEIEKKLDHQLSSKAKNDTVDYYDFLSLIIESEVNKKNILQSIDQNWRDIYFAPLIELLKMSTDEKLMVDIKSLLSKKSDGNIDNYYDGLQWLWSKEYGFPSFYADFKAQLYQYLDPHFKTYFEGRGEESIISLDEVLWGGVRQDGIPPLRFPTMVDVNEANYLNPSDLVFGFVINGIAKAYPKRILAWHEFFVDDFENIRVAGVYCTLCGTVIGYNMESQGVFHDLGTSGFLYRSNKLMYDKQTQSLWSTIEGKPVVGPLVDKGIQLETYPVVTTTWKEWNEKYPNTKVLSINTGYKRNYSEGEAYRKYFSDDALMFPVPKDDHRLKNKEEVLVLRPENYQNTPLAISVEYLRKHQIYQSVIGGLPFVVLTENNGIIRAYKSMGVKFASYENEFLLDEQSQKWVISEEYLKSPSGKYLERIPTHQIFWFAWYNMFPNTKLIR